MIEITKKQELLDKLQEVGMDDIVVLKVGAAWCGPCKTLDKTISKIEKESPESAIFLHSDIDTLSETDEDFLNDDLQIRSVPVLIYYKGGMQRLKTVGGIGEKDLLNNINKLKD